MRMANGRFSRLGRGAISQRRSCRCSVCGRLDARLVAGQQLMSGQGVQVTGNKTIVVLECRTAI